MHFEIADYPLLLDRQHPVLRYDLIKVVCAKEGESKAIIYRSLFVRRRR
jgi:hypothetical protein